MKRKIVLAVAALVIGVGLSLAFFACSSWLEMKSYQIRPAVINQADAIVVLGAAVWPNERPSPALASRVEGAVDLYKAGYAPVLVFTGGVGTYPPSEGRVAGRYAMQLGVPSEAIRFEEQSTSTWANAEGAWEISKQDDIKQVIVVSDAFHLARAKRIFTGVGFMDVQVVPAVRNAFSKVRWRWLEIRETVAIIAYRLGIKTV